MNHSWATDIDKFMVWRSGSWLKCDHKAPKKLLQLRIYYDQLIITSGNKVLESLNMHCKIKGTYKEDVIIILVSARGQEARRLKFQIKSNVDQTLKILSTHFSVVKYNSGQVNDAVFPKFRKLEEYFRHILENKDSATSLDLPSSYGEFVKVCLLDPTFPKFVQNTEKIIQDILKK